MRENTAYQLPEVELASLADSLNQFLDQLDLSRRIVVSPTRTKKGVLCLEATHRIGSRAILDPQLCQRMGKSGGLAEILRSQILLGCFPEANLPENAASPGLLREAVFKNSCLSEIEVSEGGLAGNTYLNTFSGMEVRSVPCFYGSTDGLNLAEVWETISCVKEARAKGVPSYVVFDTTGNDSLRAGEILRQSEQILPASLRKEYERFIESLGDNRLAQRIKAAQQLTGDEEVVFVMGERITLELGSVFSVGKLCLLAKLAGGDPLLFGSSRVSDLLSLGLSEDLSLPVGEFMQRINRPISGSASYYRGTVLAGDIQGALLYPFKLTDHANIYKVLARYEALYSQKEKEGAILCPIQRHRVQTRVQAQRESGDPCDVLVLAFLASKYPEALTRLKEDFLISCRVLSPQETVSLGTKDNRFIIEDYFSI